MGVVGYFKAKKALIEENERLRDIVDRTTTLFEAYSEVLTDADLAKEWHKADIRGQISKKIMSKYGKFIEYRLEKLEDGRIKITGSLRI